MCCHNSHCKCELLKLRIEHRKIFAILQTEESIVYFGNILFIYTGVRIFKFEESQHILFLTARDTVVQNHIHIVSSKEMKSCLLFDNQSNLHLNINLFLSPGSRVASVQPFRSCGALAMSARFWLNRNS